MKHDNQTNPYQAPLDADLMTDRPKANWLGEVPGSEIGRWVMALGYATLATIIGVAVAVLVNTLRGAYH